MVTDEKLFCDVALDLGFVTKQQAQEALEAHRLDAALSQPKPIATYLFDKNLITREQVAQVLKMTDRIVATQRPPFTNDGVLAPAAPVTSAVVARAVGVPVEASLTGNATSRTAYVLLGLSLGCLGVHNFYAGYVGRGIIQLLFTLVLGWVDGLGLVVTAVWALIETIAVNTDSRGARMT